MKETTIYGIMIVIFVVCGVILVKASIDCKKEGGLLVKTLYGVECIK